MLTAPIIRRDQIRGVLQVLNKRDGDFTARDEAQRDIVLYGTPRKNEKVRIEYKTGRGESRYYEASYEGVIPNLQRRYKETTSDAVRTQLEEFMVLRPCSGCGGLRLRRESLSVLVHGRSIGALVEMSVGQALRFAEALPLRAPGPPGLDPDGAGPILKEVRDRLRFLCNVGLDYLTIARSAGTLSGGEAQRIRLATQIGSRLVGVLYILDEPSIGLHHRDNGRLLATLKDLRDLGNTVLVVEHDEEMIRSALRFTISHPACPVSIPGAKSPTQARPSP
jgi:excinuclease ABC subunit A